MSYVTLTAHQRRTSQQRKLYLVRRRCQSTQDSATFGLILDKWLAESAVHLKKSTHATYRTVSDKHIRPFFGKTPVSAISADDVSRFLHIKLTALAPSTVCSIVTVLRSAMRYAVSTGEEVSCLSAISRPKVVNSETQIFTAEEQSTIENALYERMNSENAGILLCMFTGLRIGEICALRWRDISADCSTVTVRQTVQRVRLSGGSEKKTALIFDTPKSRTSMRTIPLPGFISRILLPMRGENEAFFLTGSLNFTEPRTLQAHFRRLLEDCGVRVLKFHALRHTFATRCTELGFDIKTLSEILGHADVSITLNTYVHPSLSRMREYMNLLDR